MGKIMVVFSVFFTIIIKERKNKGLRVRIAENIRPPFAVRLWNQLQNCLYHPEMELIYDYVTSRNPRHRFDHLPSPEEVAANFPNPCGWSTGMEDCMLNAGSALDILRLRREDEGGTREETAFACHLLNGIHRCATVHGRSGFIARGITPPRWKKLLRQLLARPIHTGGLRSVALSAGILRRAGTGTPERAGTPARRRALL